ncbi:MAG: DinB family protein [Candidatus Saccharimonas sp.]
MQANDVFIKMFERVQEVASNAIKGLTEEQLAMRPDGKGNSIAWMVWHISRVQDSYIAQFADREQLWTSESWFDRFALPLDSQATGYGHTSDEVASVRASAELLEQYLTAVIKQTVQYLGGLTADDYGEIIDTSYNPPVTLGVRLVSITSDITQHAGQIAYVRGLL